MGKGRKMGWGEAWSELITPSAKYQLSVFVCARKKCVCEPAFNLWWKSASRLWPIKQICSHVLVSHSHTFCNQAKELWEEARWNISLALHYSETRQATRLKRKGEKLVISAHSLWTWADEMQATQSKRFQRRAHWRLLRILMQCGIQFLWEPRGLSGKVNYRWCTRLHTYKCMLYAIHKFQSEATCFGQIFILCETATINEV